MKYTKSFTILALFISCHLPAQALLTKGEAISVALENNFGIKVSELEQKADAMQVYKSNVGMGPQVNWNAFFNTTGNNVNQNFTDGRVINRWGRAFNPGTNVSATMTVYDGGRMQAAYERLGLISQFSALQGKIVVQDIIYAVLESYYNIIRQKETIDYLNTIIGYYNERLKITEERWNVGKGSKIDFLLSKTDLNAQLSDLNRAEINYSNEKVRLNGILNRNPQEDFIAEDNSRLTTTYGLDQLIEKVKSNNRDVVLLQKSLDISRKIEEENAASFKPEVSVNGGVNYNYNNTNAGFLLSNRSVSINTGVRATWNLYDGNNRKRQLAIAKINSEIVEMQQEELEAALTNDIVFIYNQYTSNRELLEFEEENQMIVEENLTISLEKFRLGASTILELNEAQRTYDTALNRLVNAQYELRLSELELLRLTGALVE